MKRFLLWLKAPSDGSIIAVAASALMLLSGFQFLTACGSDASSMTEEETALINGSPEVMRVLTVESEDDLAVLRASAQNLSIRDLESAEYGILAGKMVRTLQSCEGGVGLAAPQVGISRRVVAVMRVDKEGEPIEVYPNIRIVEMRGEKEPGHEGCLSVPELSGEVLRYRDITIEYTAMDGGKPREIRENVTGFAAVIFQHEADHLEGTLFTDKIFLP